jgi:tetratricopeptide (TPR) repeat protein
MSFFERIFRGPSAEEWFDKGKILNRQERYEEALYAFDKCLSIDPVFAAAWDGKAWAFFNNGQFQESLEAHDRALQIDPDDAVIIENKKLLVAILGRDEEALDSLIQEWAEGQKDAKK